MDLDKSLGQIRPVLRLVGTLMIAVGVLKFLGVGIGIAYPALEFAVAGYLVKSI